MIEPRRSRLSQILNERPDARRRVGSVVAALLGIGVGTIALLGFLLIWHLVRRGRLIRERLGPPRAASGLEPTCDVESPAPQIDTANAPAPTVASTDDHAQDDLPTP